MIRKLLAIFGFFLLVLPLNAADSPLYLKGEISGLVHDEKSMSFVFSGRIELSFTNSGDYITPGIQRTTIVQGVKEIKISLQDMAITDAAKNSLQLEELSKVLVENAAKGPVTFYLMRPSIKLNEDGAITAITATWLHLGMGSRPVTRRIVVPTDIDSQVPLYRPAQRRIIVPSLPEKKD